MNKVLSFLFILILIFSCSESNSSALNPNDNNSSNNKVIIPGVYKGKLTITLSKDGSQSEVLAPKNETITFNEDGSISSDIFNNNKEKILSGALKQKTDGSYYGEYNNTATSTTYKISISVVSSSTLSVNIVEERNDLGSKETSTYIGNLSRE